MAKNFEIGKSYMTRSVCDYDCIISVNISKRTANTVTCEIRGEMKTFRIKRYEDGVESFKPWGSYSMAPIITAEKEA